MENHRTGVYRSTGLKRFILTIVALHELGDESLVGIVDLMTGEKDPRNLMLVFSILKVLMVEWDITHHVEVSRAHSMRLIKLMLDRHFSIPYIITFRLPSNLPRTIHMGSRLRI